MTHGLSPEEPRHNSKPLWSGLFIALIFASLTISTVNQALANLIPLYVDRLGKSAMYTGTFALIFSVAAVIGRISAGRLTDVRGRRWTFLTGSIAFVVATTGAAVWSSLELLMLWRVLQGLGFAAITTSVATLVADTLPQKRVAEGISYFGLGQSVASAIGPSVGIAVIGLSSIHYSFSILAVAAFCVGVVALFSRSPWDAQLHTRRLEHQADAQRPAGTLMSRLFEVRALPVFIVQFLTSLAFSQYLFFLTLFGTRSGFAHPGLFFTAAAVMMMISRFLTAKHLHRFSSTSVFIVIYGVGAASFVTVALATHEIPFIAAGLLFGFSLGLFIPLMGVIAISLVPQPRWGAANTMLFLGTDVGMGVGGMCAGFIITLVPFVTLYWVGALIMLVAFVVATLLIPSDILRRDGKRQ